MAKRGSQMDADIAERWVQDPSMSDAEYLHQRATRPDKPNIGKTLASVNLRSLMGGFCRFHGTEAQQAAASRYKALYERAQLGGGKALDPSIEPVDGGGHNPEAVFEIGADARRQLLAAHELLGPVNRRLWEYVVIGEHGPTAYARWRYGANPDGREIGRGQREIRSIADRLAELWGLQSRRSAS